MSSIIRQDMSTKDWTIFSVKRAERPHDFKGAKKKKKILEKYEPSCPFCKGNESMTPEEILAINGGKDWSVRVVPNKFPAVEYKEDSLKGSERRHITGPYLSIDGIGHHEVIIESPWHNDNIVRMDTIHVEKIIRAYRQRFVDISRDHQNQLVIIFKNHGKRAGTSLDHPHSQIVATPFVPGYIRNKMFEAQRYYDDFGNCVYCDIIKHELEDGSRLVYDNDKYLAIAPYASVMPYNIVIYPKKHQSCFAETAKDELMDLASVLRTVLKKLYDLLDDPDYNFVIDSSPVDQSGNRHYHWHLEILPRLSTRAGFEIGSGMNINSIFPETCAENLRNQKVK